MSNIILEGCMLLIAIVLFVSFQSAAGVRKNLRMSITLPHKYLDHPEVIAIINQYKKVNLAFFLISIAITFPILMIRFPSLQLLYLAIWMGIIFGFSNRLYCRYNNKLILLKSQNLWFVQDYEYRILSREKTQVRRNALLRKWLPTPLDRLLSHANGPIYVDGDEHWINGYYYNLEDRKTMVEKRVGAGFTANLATKSGKWNYYGAIAFIGIVFGTVILLFVGMDFTNFKMVVGDTKVEMKAPMYPYEFDIADIENITLVDRLPEHAIRTNGAGTETYYLGNFNIQGFGSSKVYIYREYPPYIVIELKNKTVFFNTKSTEETMEYYELLLDRVGDNN